MKPFTSSIYSILKKKKTFLTKPKHWFWLEISIFLLEITIALLQLFSDAKHQSHNLWFGKQKKRIKNYFLTFNYTAKSWDKKSTERKKNSVEGREI